MLKALWNFRGFIFCSVMRDLQKAYYGKALMGSFLILIRPLFLVFIYTVIFSKIMSHRNDQIYDTFSYTLYLCTGIFTWFYFSEVINKTSLVFLQNSNILTKSYVPRSSLPLIVFFSTTINFVIILGIFSVFLIYKGRFPGLEVLALIPVLLIQQSLALGLGIIMGTLNVFFRDIQQLLPVLIQCWFWLTPIVYPIEILPAKFRDFIEVWNPVYPIMEAYRGLFLDGVLPQWESLLVPGANALVLLAVGFLLFRSLSHDLVDEL